MSICKEADMEVTVDRHEMRWLQPATPIETGRVGEEVECPQCGEMRQARIVWIDMEKVRCAACGTAYGVWVNRAD